MRQDPVLDNERGDRSGGVFVKKNIVAYAQAHEYVDVRAGLLEGQRLANGVARGFLVPVRVEPLDSQAVF